MDRRVIGLITMNISSAPASGGGPRALGSRAVTMMPSALGDSGDRGWREGTMGIEVAMVGSAWFPGAIAIGVVLIVVLVVLFVRRTR
jgi:hypothetical protein